MDLRHTGKVGMRVYSDEFGWGSIVHIRSTDVMYMGINVYNWFYVLFADTELERFDIEFDIEKVTYHHVYDGYGRIWSRLESTLKKEFTLHLIKVSVEECNLSRRIRLRVKE